jgi:hypothetical protein
MRYLSSVLVLSTAAAASAQSINIDFGSSAGVPPATYAAEGLPGHWNAIDLLLEPGETSNPIFLNAIDGTPLTAFLTVIDGYGTLDYPHPEPTRGDAAILNDALFALGPGIEMRLSLDGLMPGRYRVITYTWDYPTDSFGVAVNIHDLPTAALVTGGPWTGALTYGVTHRTHVVDSDGTMLVQLVGAGPGSFFNGSCVINAMQLVRFDDAIACPADLDDSGEVDGADLGLLLGAWGSSGAADIDGSGEVDGADLGLLLGAWGFCPVPAPAQCGGDAPSCDEPHAQPGCGEAPCCEVICFFDAFCCEIAWDDVCVQMTDLTDECAAGVHPHCGNPLAGDCLSQQDSLPGCADADCCDSVCEFDFFCCVYAWDLVCVEEAELFCSRIPAGCGHPESGDCFVEHWTPWCTDEACCELICKLDSFCCEIQWDDLCASYAAEFCRPPA